MSDNEELKPYSTYDTASIPVDKFKSLTETLNNLAIKPEVKPKKKTYFDIVEAYNSLLDGVEALDGELTEEIEQALVVNQEELTDKLSAYQYRIKLSKKHIEFLKERKTEFDARIARNERLIEKLDEVCSDALLRFGETTYNKDGKFKNYVLETEEFKLINVYSTSVEIDDETSIPDEYKTREISVREIDAAIIPENILIKNKTVILKDAIKQQLKDGKVIPGASLDTSKFHIRWY